MEYSLLVFLLSAQLALASDDLGFLFVGDWGGINVPPYYTKLNLRIAEAMNVEAKRINSQFQIGLGDNFYFFGVDDVNSKRFQNTFENVFNGEALQTDWYHTAGNHDYLGNISAQIAYTQLSKRWQYPDLYYTEEFKAPDGATMQLVLIDTMILCGMVQDEEGGQPIPFADKDDAEAQWLWIEETLASSSADYLIVGGHFPVYSIGGHGPTALLVERLKPLLYKYNVTMYLAGHDHNLQHLQEVLPDGRTMDYVIAAAATYLQDFRWHEDDVPAGSLKFYDGNSVGGFGSISMNKVSMTVSLVSGENKELHQTVLKPRKWL